jgi:Tol biopolymer transport system component
MITNSRRLAGRVDEGRGTVRATPPSILMTLALLAGSLLIVNAAPAQAAYPGDNGRIVVVGDGGHGTWDIITMDADGTDRVNLTQGAFDAESPAWSPDGTRIAFSTIAGSPSGCRTGDVYVMNADGSDMTPLTTSAFGVAAYDPTWSPDGSEIAFTREHWDAACTSGDIDIWKMSADGSGQVLLTAGANAFGPAFDGEPAWSPDGDRIAFRSDRDNADWAYSHQIYTMDPDGANVTQVTHLELNTFVDNSKPAWSPDGEQIAFERQQGHPDPPAGQSRWQIWRINEDGTGETGVTANSFLANMDPAWSPDGQRILFANHFEKPTGFDNDLYAINPDGTDQVNVTNSDSPEVHPDWQPLAPPDPVPAGKIAWVSAGPAGSFTDDIWTMDPDGSNQTNLLPGDVSDFYPEWSRDGTKIAFSRSGTYPSGCIYGDIFVMDADGSNVTQVTANPIGVSAIDPTWSPDGQRLAFTRAQQDETCTTAGGGIWVMNADGTGQTALTAVAADSEPAWSPDGTRIAFTSWDRPNDDGDRYDEIYTMNADGSGIARLTDTVFPDTEINVSPAWSPDGQTIAFVHESLLTYDEIWVMNADGTGETAVTQNSFVANIQPTWSPDGTRIAFSGLEAFGLNNEIYTIDVDGSDQLQVTDNDVIDWMPTWQPVVQPPAVAAPTFTGTDPVSPANDNNPRIIGTAAGAVTVTLYETADCSGTAAAQGPATDFASAGLPVTVPDNSTTTFYGTATDANANTSACSTSSVTYIEDSAPADLVVTDCADPALNAVTSIEGALIVQDLPTCESLSLPALTDAGGVLVTGSTALEAVNLASLVTVSGDITITDNGSVAVNLTSLTTVSGDVTVAGNDAAAVNLTSLTTVSGDVTVTGNDAAAVNLTSLTTVSGDLTITDNGSASLNLADGGTVAGNVTIEGQGAGEFELPAVSGDLTLDGSGYDTVSGATAGGTTSISNTDGQAVMRVLLPEGTFETPVAFTITRLEPATLLPEGGTGADGEAATVDPLAAYSFEFAVPVLGLDATLSFDVLLDSLDADARAALLAALDAGTATLVTKGGAAGDTYQAFALCSGGAVPTADGCVLIERLDADGQPTTGTPAIVRFTGVTGHFSTWGVAVVEPIPPPDPRAQLEALLRDVEAASIQAGLRLDLANKLQAALKALAKDPPDIVVACEKVADFARKVELESSKKDPKIAAALAARWLEAATDIRSDLGC